MQAGKAGADYGAAAPGVSEIKQGKTAPAGGEAGQEGAGLPPLRLGIAGLGTVGGAVLRLLRAKAAELALKCGRPLQIAALSARSRAGAAARGLPLANAAWHDNAAELAASADIDVFIELIGGESGIAYAAVAAALKRGCAVITANKALLARHGAELAALAERHNAPLYYEAAIAGGIPIVKTLREALAGNAVTRICGILNGTGNYILTRMEGGLDFAAALRRAQELGYAEADPSFDIDGYDSAHKLALLASLAFGVKAERAAPHCEGIRNLTRADIAAARELGYRIKLLGIAAQTSEGIEQSVRPVMLAENAPLARVSGASNAILVESAELGELLLSGPGAGGDATASAVLGDIADIAKSGYAAGRPAGGAAIYRAPAVFGWPAAAMAEFAAAPEQLCRGGYFIRLEVHDKIGVFASIAGIMAENGISLESIVQKAPAETEAAPGGGAAGAGQAAAAADNAAGCRKTIILITHATKESAVRRALAAAEAASHLLDAPRYIRIERADSAAAGR